MTNLVSDLAARPTKGSGWNPSRAAVIDSGGALPGAVGNASDCVLVDGTSAANANVTHTHAASDVNSGTLALVRGGTAADLSATGPGFLKQASSGAAETVEALASGDLPSHTHTSAQISDATANAAASTVVLRDSSAGTNFGYVAANNLWAHLESHFQSVECGAFQAVGGAFENMAKYSEDFSLGTWDKNGGSCSVTANSTTAPDGNTTANTVTASTSTPIIQQQIAGLVSGAQYTFYVGQGCERDQTGLNRHRGQRLCHVPRRSCEHRAHTIVAAVQDHRNAGWRSDRAVDRRAAVRRQRRQLDLWRPPALGARVASRAMIRRRDTRVTSPIRA